MSQDYRLLPAAASAWFAAFWITQGHSWILIAALVVIGLFWWRQAEVLLCVLVIAIVAIGTVIRLEHRTGSDLTNLNVATFRVVTEPRAVTQTQWWFTARVNNLPVSVTSSTPVSAHVGDRLVADVQFTSSDDSRYAAFAQLDEITAIESSPWWLNWSNPVREQIKRAAQSGPQQGATLVPALVHGDDSAQSSELKVAFRRSGLTHLLAVSGTNLTIVLALMLGLATSLGARGRWRIGIGILAVFAFVILARPEPSVLRAAAMGSVGVLGLRRGGRGGARALALAVLALLIFDPWMSASAGFVLSVCATAGILFLVPKWTALLNLPSWLALLITVPLAAQLACAPMLVVLSGEVSLVSVLANGVAAPFVAPATIFGLWGGLFAFVLPPLGMALGFFASACAQAIVQIALYSASFSGAAFSWTAPWWALALVCLLVIGALPFVLSRRWVLALVSGLLLFAIWQPLDFGWPPKGWVFAACDVGQGDGLVINAGAGDAIVVDSGPEPFSMARCLRKLNVKTVRLFVVTHDQQDHNGGASAVAAPITKVHQGQQFEIGDAKVLVLSPKHDADAGDLNNSSAVMLVTVRSVRILLTGDIEAETQAELAKAGIGGVDVLKVPHHGSGNFSSDFIAATRARIAVISVGKDNDYGHPHSQVLKSLRTNRMLIARTDEMGDVVVAYDNQRLFVVAR